MFTPPGSDITFNSNCPNMKSSRRSLTDLLLCEMRFVLVQLPILPLGQQIPLHLSHNMCRRRVEVFLFHQILKLYTVFLLIVLCSAIPPTRSCCVLQRAHQRRQTTATRHVREVTASPPPATFLVWQEEMVRAWKYRENRIRNLFPVVQNNR